MQIIPISNINPRKSMPYEKKFSYAVAMPENIFEQGIQKQTAATNSFIPSLEYFQPLSFGKIKREFSSDNKKLAEKSGDFIVTRFSDITCPSCGKKMLSMRRFEQISEELSEIEPDKYLDFLSQYTQYMRPVEESVFNEIFALSKQPGHTKDIRELVVELREKKLPILQEAQMRLIKKMQSLARTLPEEEKNVLQNKVTSLKKIVYKNNSTSPFRRKIMIDRISKVKIRNPRKYDKLQTIAKSFPTSRDMNSAWIVKYSGKNKRGEEWASYDIALRLLSSSVANTDHIIAYNIENNHDDISNYLAMHNACNSQKGNKTFLQWLYEDKENRIKYMKDYFTSVSDLISSNRIGKKKYKNYVAHATNTIYEASKGQIKLLDDKFEEPKLPKLPTETMQ